MVVLSEVRQVNPSKATAQIDVTTSRGDNTKPNTICQQYHEKRINKNNKKVLLYFRNSFFCRNSEFFRVPKAYHSLNSKKY